MGVEREVIKVAIQKGKVVMDVAGPPAKEVGRAIALGIVLISGAIARKIWKETGSGGGDLPTSQPSTPLEPSGADGAGPTEGRRAA